MGVGNVICTVCTATTVYTIAIKFEGWVSLKNESVFAYHNYNDYSSGKRCLHLTITKFTVNPAIKF